MTLAGLDHATALAGADGVFRADLSPQWEIWGPNGGYLAAIALRAAGEVANINRPTGINCHFLRAPAFEPIEIRAEALHAGRRAEAISVQAEQNGRIVLNAIVRAAKPDPCHESAHLQAPLVATPDELDSEETDLYPFWANLERRPLPRTDSALACQEWVRFRPAPTLVDPFADAGRALILLDAFGWPAAFGRVGEDSAYVAPSLDISAWFHRPMDHAEWLLLDEVCPVSSDGLIATEGHVWDQSGQLLATGASHLCSIAR